MNIIIDILEKDKHKIDEAKNDIMAVLEMLGINYEIHYEEE